MKRRTWTLMAPVPLVGFMGLSMLAALRPQPIPPKRVLDQPHRQRVVAPTPLENTLPSIPPTPVERQTSQPLVKPEKVGLEAVPPRGETSQEFPSGWIYKAVLDGHWTIEQVELLKGLFLNPPDRDTWAIATWGLEKCPSPEVPYWIDQFIRGPAPAMDRVHAVTVLTQRLEPSALAVLQTALTWPEEAIHMAALRAIQVRAGWDESAKNLAVSLGKMIATTP